MVVPARQPATTPGPRRRTANSIDRAGPAGERHASTISISLDLKAAGRAIRAAGGGNRGAAAVLRQEMSTMTRRPPLRRPLPVGLADTRRPRPDPALGLRPRRRGCARAPRRPRPRPRHRRPGRRHRDLGQPAQRLRPPLRAVDQRVAALARLPRLPRARCCSRPASAAPSRCSTRRCAPTRRPATSARRRPSTSPTPPSASGSARSRTPSRRAEYQDVLQQEADLTAGHGILRATGLIAVSAARSRRTRARRRRRSSRPRSRPRARPGDSGASRRRVSPSLPAALPVRVTALA